MADDLSTLAAIVPTTGRRLALPPGPIFALQRAAETVHEIGAFRKWAGYKDLGSDAATAGLAHFQHVLSFGPTEASGRTGVHVHLAHAHIVIPTSGRGVFSYDGVVTEALPGSVIVQHGGTVHDQFDYSFAGASEADNRLTPLSVEPAPAGAPAQSFGFLELFVPTTIADVEIVPPEAVTPSDAASAWDHPYHAAGACFALQAPDAPGAAYRPLAGRPGLAVRDCDTWEPSGRLVTTWILRAAARPPPGAPISLSIPGEPGGIDILFMVAGSASFRRSGGEPFTMGAGDCLTCTAGIADGPFEATPDLRLLHVFISARAEALHERTPDEIDRLQALGPHIVTRREVRPAGDHRPINYLHGPA